MLNASESGVLFVETAISSSSKLDSAGAAGAAQHRLASRARPRRPDSTYDSLLAGAPDDEILVDVDEDEPTRPDLHLRHHGAAEGRRADLPQPRALRDEHDVARPTPMRPRKDAGLGDHRPRRRAHRASCRRSGAAARWSSCRSSSPEQWLEAVQNEERRPTLSSSRRCSSASWTTRTSTTTTSRRCSSSPTAPRRCRYEVVCRAIDVFTCGLMNAYGQTESTSSLTYLGPDDHRLDGSAEENEKKLHRLRSVGRPMDDVDDRDHGLARPPRWPSGDEGEICVQSARVMKEYLKQADATADGDHRWLAAHRRRGLPGRGQLPLHHGPRQGPDHPRRREHLRRRDRGRRSTATRRSKRRP